MAEGGRITYLICVDFATMVASLASQKNEVSMLRYRLLPLFLVCIPFGSAQADSSLQAKLAACATEANDAQRLACFDALAAETSGSNLAEQEASAAADTTEQEPGELEALPDSIGGGAFAEAAGIKAKSYAGRVTSCKKSADRRWFYIFENGQVWKQVDRRKRRHKECDFEVTLTEDSFGYVMRIAGQDSKIRVDRIR